VQQLAVSYIRNGYWFYVTGVIPGHKDPREVDRKLIERYGIDISKWARARRKTKGLANVHYMRHDRFFVLIATHGTHRIFLDEPTIRDVRRAPIRFAGYSISFRRGFNGTWHPSVRIERETYMRLKDYLVEASVRRSYEWMWRALRQIPFEPYAPVRRQMLLILAAVNHRRRGAGLETFPYAVLRLSRRPAVVFGDEPKLAEDCAIERDLRGIENRQLRFSTYSSDFDVDQRVA
jgi:hypothetical protein